MTREQLFERIVRERIAMARAATGHSFFLLLDALEREGAVKMARRFIDPRHSQTFQDGLLELQRAGLLHLSVEQAIIDFNGKRYIFTDAEADSARERLRVVELLA